MLTEMLGTEVRNGLNWTDVPLVLRVYDRTLGIAVAQRFGFENVRSTVELAAPWFIGAAVGLQVLGTFSVGQRSFMVGGMQVARGSELDGLRMFELSTATRVIAITRPNSLVSCTPPRCPAARRRHRLPGRALSRTARHPAQRTATSATGGRNARSPVVRIAGRDAIAAAIGLILAAAAFIVPRMGWGIVSRLHLAPDRFGWHADAAPIFGWFEAHLGWGTAPAIALGLAVVVWGTAVAQRLSWRTLPLAGWVTSCGWAFSLAMIDGWQRGFAGRLTDKDEYLPQVRGITDIPEALRTFSGRILDFQPNSWVTHVSGHPPGALLTFVWLDRIGLGGGAWAGLLCLLVGSSAAAAILITLRALADEPTARRAAPFVAVPPTAIWIAVSADGYFAGVAAWGIALLALAVRGRVRWPLLDCGSGRAAARLGGVPQLRPDVAGDSGVGGAGLRATIGARRCGQRARQLRSRPQSRRHSRRRDSAGMTVIPLYSNAIGRASPMTGRFSTGAGPTSPRWCARSGWAASPDSAGSST